jgi:plastocyanin
MGRETQSRPDLVEEVRFRIPLPLPVVIPVGALILIGALTFGFSRVLLALPAEAATTVALVTAANILVACAFIAAHRRMAAPSVIEIGLIALYPVLIGIVIALTGFGAEPATGEGAQTQSEQASAEGSSKTESGGGGPVEIVAENLSFDTDEIALVAGKETEITVDNQDSALHNLAVYESEEAASSGDKPIAKSPDVPAGSSEGFSFTPPSPGELFFRCDYHPTTMKGAVTVTGGKAQGAKGGSS